jgi:hypothetical protein
LETVGQMSDLQEKASALLARIDGGQQTERGGRLAPSDRVLILRLDAKGCRSQSSRK